MAPIIHQRKNTPYLSTLYLLVMLSIVACVQNSCTISVEAGSESRLNSTFVSEPINECPVMPSAECATRHSVSLDDSKTTVKVSLTHVNKPACVDEYAGRLGQLASFP